MSDLKVEEMPFTILYPCFHSPVHSDVPLKRKTKQKKVKHRHSVGGDSGYTTQRFLENLPSTIAQVIPRHFSDSECTAPLLCSTDENGGEVGDGILLSPKSESNAAEIDVANNSCSLDESFVSGGSPKSTGYDFSKYTNGMDIPTWSPRVSSRGSFTSSWSSTDEEDTGWLSGSEESCDEQAYAQTDSFHSNRATEASVWCVDCKGDLVVTGCSDGAIEVLCDVYCVINTLKCVLSVCTILPSSFSRLNVCQRYNSQN